MKASWALEHFGNLLSPVERPEAVDPTKSYRLLGARWYAQGLFIKDEKSGQSIKANTLYKVQSGDFVYNRLFAWKGSFAIADAISDACHVSNEFPCFAINKRKLNPHFLKWWFSRESAWNKALGLSTGATPTSRNRLKEAQLLAMVISLPPLAEQDRIVRRIDELVKRVEEARRLRRELDSEINLLPRAILASDKSGRTIEVGQFAALRAPDVTVKPTEQYHFAGVYCFGRGVFPSVSKMGSEFAYPRLTRLRAGNFVYPKLMAWEGALGMVPLNCDNLVVSTEFPVFEINEEISLC
jgi:type I restriction enzyme S subunit